MESQTGHMIGDVELGLEAMLAGKGHDPALVGRTRRPPPRPHRGRKGRTRIARPQRSKSREID
ncbi:MAG TPA: hypothetical protein VGH49_08060 [Xanthobacteraceae bacterium]